MYIFFAAHMVPEPDEVAYIERYVSFCIFPFVFTVFEGWVPISGIEILYFFRAIQSNAV